MNHSVLDTSWHRASVEAFEQETRLVANAFTVVTEAQLQEKLRAETPYIWGQYWSFGGPPGTIVTHNVRIHNPTSNALQWGFVSDFFGLANFAANIESSLSGRNERWGMLSDGPLSIEANSFGSARFKWTVPNVLPGVYTGNSVLWKGQLHSQGEYYDRALWWISVTGSA